MSVLDTPTEGEYRFVHPDGDEVVVGLSNFEYLGSGSRGDVFAVRATIKSRVFEATFAFKKFRAGRMGPVFRDIAVRAYSIAKEVGMKVFTDYLPEVDGSGILMTNGNFENAMCLDIRQNVRHRFGVDKIDEIPNFDQFTADLFDQVKLALDSGVVFKMDALFFFIEKGEGVGTARRIDFKFGDLDNISCTDDLDSLRKCYDAVILMIPWFLENNVKEPRRTEYCESFTKFFNERRKLLKIYADS